jgi:peptidyl-prolyl cis-trans isomerase C
MMGRWLREPLLQFLVVGVLLFVGWRVVSPDSYARSPTNRIVLTEGDLKQLATTWVMAGRAPPSPQQLQRLIADKVREEVLYREALALGLDKDDTIVKRQLARKMEFLAEDVSKLEEPKPGELKAWFEKNGERFAMPPRVTFRHVYFSPDRRGAMVRTDAERALTQLTGKPMDSPSIATAGDPFMFQQFYGDRPFDEIARQFGPSFARALVQLTPGGWAGPIESGYGWHIVFAEAVTPQRVPDYEEIESEVKRAWMEDRRSEVKARMYQAMLARYEVVLPTQHQQQSAPPVTGVMK